MLVASILASASAQMVKRFSADQMRMLHSEMDSDNDALVTLAEASKFVRNLRTVVMLEPSLPIMRSMDANKDGFLSLDEFETDLRDLKMEEARKEGLVRSFPSFDGDGDAKLSTQEALPLFNLMFPFWKLDANKDGALSLKEFKQIAARKLESAAPEELKESHKEGRSIFAALDADGDGRLDAKEHYSYESGIYAGLAALDKLFELADADGDGRLSADEMVEARKHPQFGNSAAFHHSYDWMTKIERALAAEQARGKKSEL